MSLERGFSERELLDRMAQAIACMRTGAPPRGELQHRRFVGEAKAQLRDLVAAGLARSFS